MSRAARFERWFLASVPARRIQALRMILGGFIALYLAIRIRFFLDLADLNPVRWDPAGVLVTFDDPWPDAAVTALVWVSLALAMLYGVGIAFRVVGPALTVALLLLFTYRSSWGQLLHFENLMLLHVGLLSFAEAGRTRGNENSPRDVSAWPIRLITIVTAITYVLAGWSKLRFGGGSWLFGDTLRNHVASANVRLEVLGERSSPFGRWLVTQAWAFPPLAIATVAIELGAGVAFISSRLRTAWVAAAWLMHAGIAATMFIVFPMPFFLVAFVPFFVVPDGPSA